HAVQRELREAANRRALVEQRAFLEQLIAHIPCGVFWKDRKGVYLGCNEQTARDLGLSSPADLVGKTDRDTQVSPQEADYYTHCDREVMEIGRPLLNIEETQRRPDGSRAVLLTSKAPLRGAGGAVGGVLGVYSDITERKRAEEDRALLAAIVESSEDSIISIDLDGVVRTWNPGAQRLYGYTAQEMVGRHIDSLVPPGLREDAHARRARAARGERAAPF